MPSAPPSALSENAGLAFIGEATWPLALITSRRAQTLTDDANPTGRPNSDVLREFIGAKSVRPQRHWQIDFPSHFTAQEAALYVHPWQHLRLQVKEASGTWWLNPHAQRELRPALARLERYLATPLVTPDPTWDWIDSSLLPEDNLLVVARDDDFTQGLLSSRLFQLWWRQHAPRISPAMIVAAFPFPWSPATLLSALTRTQEELRLALARAARGGDLETLNSAATAAYGWPADMSDEDVLTKLAALNRKRPPAGL